MRKLFNRYLVLTIFVGLTIVGVGIRFVAGASSWLWDLWGVVDVSLAVSLGVMAFLAYRELIRSEDEVRIYFLVDKNKIDTQLSILRKDFTRGELMGILGMIQRDPKQRYIIKELSSKQILTEIHAIQKGKELAFILRVESGELEQFNL
ncbi:MAG: hypothetical protein U9R27_10275 [Campylobacterota bacterium]|nr:hypothetical protein [Campylobacterota bacterium]